MKRRLASMLRRAADRLDPPPSHAKTKFLPPVTEYPDGGKWGNGPVPIANISDAIGNTGGWYL